jgi:hypothetical protein
MVASPRLMLLAHWAAAAGLGVGLALVWPGPAPAQDAKIKTVTLWVNAFIPKDIKVTGKPDLTRAVPGKGPHASKTMIPGPVPGVSDCFLTDQRGFDPDPKASSRMHNKVTVDLAKLALAGPPDRRCDPTVEVDCEDGAEECSKAAKVDRIEVKEFSAAAGTGGGATVKFRLLGAADNACFVVTPGMLVPDIDWDLPVTVEVAPGGEQVAVRVKGAIEVFPAFEMYAAAGAAKPVAVFQEPPVDGKTPRDLFGPPARKVEKAVTLGSLMDGTWQSTDADKRFRLEIAGKAVTWTERRPSGATLAKKVEMAAESSPHTFRISRPNDEEVLKFLDFPDAGLRAAILAARPESSFLVLSRDGDKLVGQWHGLLVRKMPNGKFKEIVQPSAMAAKAFEFKR